MKFKRIIVLTILIFTILSLFLLFVSADVWVNGYTRKNGTYVQGYWRSDPNSNPYDNFGFPGNVNPHTGKVAPGNPETYLKNYYDSDSYNFFADVWVNGYYRKNGTYVQGYWRSDPNSNPYDNFGFPGNVNPHTGKVAPGNPETYLKNYYNINSSSSKKVGFSSVDNVHTAVAINNVGKVINAPPITIGSSIEDVIRTMGSPESVQTSPNGFKYRYSFVYFDNDWKVQSWVNKGNLKVSLKDEKKDDLLNIDQSLFDEAFKPENDHVKKKSSTSEDNRTVDEMVEEFLGFLKNQ